MNTKNVISIILRLVIAIIFLQTLFFKFSGHPDSVHIFTALGVEPWGRITLGIIELITSILVLLPRTKTVGVVLSLALIFGAIVSHLFVLGINVANDGGKVFMLALTVFFASILYLIINRKDFIELIPKR